MLSILKFAAFAVLGLGTYHVAAIPLTTASTFVALSPILKEAYIPSTAVPAIQTFPTQFLTQTTAETMRDGLVNTKLEVIPGTQWAEFQKTAAPAVSAAAESRMQQLISIRSSERAAEIAAASTYSSLAAARSSSSQAAAAESSAAAEYSKEEERAYEHRWSTLPSCEIHNWHQWKDIHFHHIPALNASALAMHSNHFYQFKAGTPKKQWLAETGKLLKGHLLKCATATGGISRFIDLTYNDDGHQDATGTGHLSFHLDMYSRQHCLEGAYKAAVGRHITCEIIHTA